MSIAPDPTRTGFVPRVLVLQHTLEDGPGHLGTWLDRQGVVWQAPCAQAGQTYPDSLAGYCALAVLGGEWGANDARASLQHARALIRQADALGIPVLGHCLGGQLLARALGGEVCVAQRPEVGWLPMRHDGSALAQQWFGPEPEAVVYQWHYDTVSRLPNGARSLAHSSACAVQAFAVGPHLGMQFHIEITAQKIDDWLAHPGARYPDALLQHPDTVQDAPTMHLGTAIHLGASQRLAEQIYTRWRRHWVGIGAD